MLNSTMNIKTGECFINKEYENKLKEIYEKSDKNEYLEIEDKINDLCCNIWFTNQATKEGLKQWCEKTIQLRKYIDKIYNKLHLTNNNKKCYCETKEPLLIETFSHSIGFENVINAEKECGVIIDRCNLRLVDLDDCNCLDHGEKIKIYYCPICGKKLHNNKEEIK